MDDIKKRKSIKAVVVPPTREQFTKLLQAMRNNKYDASKESPTFIEILAYTGMRLEEARQVQWRHIDFQKESILVTGGRAGDKKLQPTVTPALCDSERVT